MASKDDYEKALSSIDLNLFKPNSDGSQRKAMDELDVYQKLQMLMDYINNLKAQQGVDPKEAAQAQEILASQDPALALQNQPGFAERLIQDYSRGALDNQIQNEAQVSGEAMSDQEAAQLADQQRLKRFKSLQDLGSLLIPRATSKPQE